MSRFGILLSYGIIYESFLLTFSLSPQCSVNRLGADMYSFVHDVSVNTFMLEHMTEACLQVNRSFVRVGRAYGVEKCGLSNIDCV